MQKPPPENNCVGDICDGACDRNVEIRRYLTEIKDLIAAVNLWHDMLKAVINNTTITPVVYAAEKENVPTKPPKMKYKDLPMYKTPHLEYKEYIENKQRCPDTNVKVIQRSLFPIVHKYRVAMAESFYELKKDVNDLRKEICNGFYARTKELKTHMRHPDNLPIRKATVVLWTMTGFYIGSGTRGICKKIIFATLGALAGGSLCFPKETDEIVRNTAYSTGKFMIALFNFTCRQNFSLRERIPCPGDLPPPPAKLTDDQINKKCNVKK